MDDARSVDKVIVEEIGLLATAFDFIFVMQWMCKPHYCKNV